RRRTPRSSSSSSAPPYPTSSADPGIFKFNHFDGQRRVTKLSTVPAHRSPSPAHSSTGPSATDGTTARQKERAGGLYQATGTSHRPLKRSNNSFAAREPTLCRRYFRITKNSPTDRSSGRSSADHRFIRAKPARRPSAEASPLSDPTGANFEKSYL